MVTAQAKRLILVLGDQLSPDLSSLEAGDKSSDIIVMGELKAEASYVRHHKKKLAFVFSAMRHFAEELRHGGWTVDYATYNDGYKSFTDLVKAAAKNHGCKTIIVTSPGEWRVVRELENLGQSRGYSVEILHDDRFICTNEEFSSWAEGRKALRMEYFYREMRRKTGLLMDGEDPVGGQWNFDQENRKPPKEGLDPPDALRIEPDAITKEVLTLVDEEFGDHFGDLDPFWFAVTRDDALKALDRFIDEALPLFGDYQDAMVGTEKFLYHSLLGLYINIGLLDPLHVCQEVEAAYNDNRAPLNAVEGFIRQIIGWREFVRGIYWREGPDYVTRNFFGHDRELPDFYWSGETDMACVGAAVTQTKEEAYAHHIQRLMVTGTFALIAGINPHEVHEWYLAVYADAYEWVEAPNVVGMALFADGGLLGSKPYAASGAYINRMSDYCKGCSYSVSKKTEENACPFNSLYWDFLARHQETLGNNARLGQIYSNWERMDGAKQRAYRTRAQHLLEKLDRGERI
ncbi:MAG: cryptochrome/photolyase family protein [Pseudomonadota bacterium]